MNHFELSGAIVSIEQRLTKRGSAFHVVTIADDEGIEIQTALFGRDPRVGDWIELTGKLVTRSGFLNLAVESTCGDLVFDERNPIPLNKADEDPHPLPDLRRGGRWRPPPPESKRNLGRGEDPPPPLPSLKKGTASVVLDYGTDDDLPF